MKFIFPQNYNFTSKLLGFIDYTTVILNIIWGIITFSFVYFFIPNASMERSVMIGLMITSCATIMRTPPRSS